MGKKNCIIFLIWPLVFSVHGEARIDCSKQMAHLFNVKEQTEHLAPEAQERVVQLFSELPRVGRFLPQTLAKKKAMAQTLKQVIAEEGLIDRIFLKGLRNPSSLSLEDRRALHLMFNRQWLFHTGQSSFYRISTLIRFLRISYHLRHRYGSVSSGLQRFLHEVSQTPFSKRILNRFSYIGNIHRLITSSPHSSDLLLGLKRERANLVFEWERADNKTRPSLEAQREHLDHLISVITTENFESPSRRLPEMSYLIPELVERTEIFAYLWILLWLFTDDNQEAAVVPSGETLPITTWNSPIEEERLEDTPAAPEDTILIQCNLGLIPMEKCLELLD